MGDVGIQEELDGLHDRRAALLQSVDGYRGTLASLSSSISAKREEIAAVERFRDVTLSELSCRDDDVQAALRHLGADLVTGTQELGAKFGVLRINNSNAGYIGDAKNACNRLISRLNRELSGLQSQYDDKQRSLVLKQSRLDDVDRQIRSLNSQLS